MIKHGLEQEYPIDKNLNTIVLLGNVGNSDNGPISGYETIKTAARFPDSHIYGIDVEPWTPPNHLITQLKPIDFLGGLSKFRDNSIDCLFSFNSVGCYVPNDSILVAEYTYNIVVDAWNKLKECSQFLLSAEKEVTNWYYTLLETTGLSPVRRDILIEEMSYFSKPGYSVVTFTKHRNNGPKKLHDFQIAGNYRSLISP